MATITSIGSGLWSAAGTWDAGVPADGDAVVIASGHTVTFDVNQSAWVTGLDGITITGILEFSRIAGTYYLMLKAATCITGAGTMNVGTALNPIPFDAKHTITGGNGWYITGTSGLTLNVYAAEPQYKYVRLSNSALNGATTLEVDTDLTGDIWESGDMIFISRPRSYAGYDRIINTVTATTITVTVGISSALDTFAIVVLISRNVRFLEAGGTADGIIRLFSTAGKLSIAGGQFLGSGTLGSSGSLIRNCPYLSISGGSFYKTYFQLHTCAYAMISGGSFCNQGITYGFSGLHNAILSGGLFTGYYIAINNCKALSFTGADFICVYILFPSTAVGAFISDGLFESMFYLAYGSNNITLAGGQYVNIYALTHQATFIQVFGAAIIASSCSYFFSESANCIAYNLNFNSVNEVFNPTNISYHNITQSIHHNAVDGAYKAWTMGGTTISQATTKPTGYVQAYQMALANADWECFWKKAFTIAAGETVVVEVQLRKDAAMTYLPRAYLMEGIYDPISGALPTQSFIMTDSVDTWESETFSITNNTDYDHDYTLWFVAKNATGNVYAAYTIQTIPDTADIAQAVWSYATKELTTPADYMADVSALATSAEIAALNDLDAAGIRAAIGLAVANLDQQFLDLVAWAAINLDESITEGEIIQIRGNSWTIAIDDLILSINKQQFAIKYTHLSAPIHQSPSSWRSSSPDADSLIFIDSDTGLLYLNGVSAADPSLGSLSYVGTTLTVTLSPAATYLLTPGTYTFGIQSVDALGYVSEAYGGTFIILADVVRSIS
jgi:hypothetical protein